MVRSFFIFSEIYSKLLFLVISRIGTILVDGKVYPPVQTPSGSVTPPAPGPNQMPPHQPPQQQVRS